MKSKSLLLMTLVMASSLAFAHQAKDAGQQAAQDPSVTNQKELHEPVETKKPAKVKKAKKAKKAAAAPADAAAPAPDAGK